MGVQGLFLTAQMWSMWGRYYWTRSLLLDEELIAGEDWAYGLYVLEVDGEKPFAKKVGHIGHSM